jgi:hypothetical protein
MDDILEAAPEIKKPLPLDPFGAHPQWTSRISSLGGHEACGDPGYVFATLHCRPALGRVSVQIQLHEMTATCGALRFSLRVCSAFPGAPSSDFQEHTVDATALARAGGILALDFESHHNARYGVTCHTEGTCDVTAEHISVTISARAGPQAQGRPWGWTGKGKAIARRRAGIDETLVERLLTDLDLPTLEAPMSQAASPQQCGEQAYRDALQLLGREPIASFDNWAQAYVLRAITRFGTADTPCRMLGYAAGEAPLLSYFAKRGAEVVGLCHAAPDAARSDPGRLLEDLRCAPLCDEKSFFDHAYAFAEDTRHPIEPLRDQFDVLWSIGAQRWMTQQEFAYFVVNSLAHVKPGGLAVHVFNYVENNEAEITAALTRGQIERIAALALSFGNDVVRLRFRHGADLPSSEAPLPFGIVLLRGTAVELAPA